jgi:hypothetical protein
MSENAHGWAKVKIPSDIHQLLKWYFVTIEPPYWYLRCRGCDQRNYVPWDARLRTQDAIETLRRHGEACCESHHGSAA